MIQEDETRRRTTTSTTTDKEVVDENSGISTSRGTNVDNQIVKTAPITLKRSFITFMCFTDVPVLWKYISDDVVASLESLGASGCTNKGMYFGLCPIIQDDGEISISSLKACEVILFSQVAVVEENNSAQKSSADRNDRNDDLIIPDNPLKQSKYLLGWRYSRTECLIECLTTKVLKELFYPLKVIGINVSDLISVNSFKTKFDCRNCWCEPSYPKVFRPYLPNIFSHKEYDSAAVIEPKNKRVPSTSTTLSISLPSSSSSVSSSINTAVTTAAVGSPLSLLQSTTQKQLSIAEDNNNYYSGNFDNNSRNGGDGVGDNDDEFLRLHGSPNPLLPLINQQNIISDNNNRNDHNDSFIPPDDIIWSLITKN
jgi:hypothetical protein